MRTLGEQLRAAFPLRDADECMAATLARLAAEENRAPEMHDNPTDPINDDGGE